MTEDLDDFRARARVYLSERAQPDQRGTSRAEASRGATAAVEDLATDDVVARRLA